MVKTKKPLVNRYYRNIKKKSIKLYLTIIIFLFKYKKIVITLSILVYSKVL